MRQHPQMAVHLATEGGSGNTMFRFTGLTTSRGDEAGQEILHAQRDLTRQKVEEHSAVVGPRGYGIGGPFVP